MSENEERIFPIAPDNINLLNPRLSEIRGEHDFTAADITALSNIGIVFVNDLISLPKASLQNVYNSIPEPMFGKKINFSDFKRTITDLKDAFPQAHYFLAQPVRQSQEPESESKFVGRPNGGRDGSGMLMG